MMSRTQITLDPEIQRRARKRASDLGVSLAEYLRRLVARDLAGAPTKADPAAVFDLGSSGGCNIAKDKSDEHYLWMGRVATAGGIIISIGTAYLVMKFSSIMDYMQLIFSFFKKER